MSTRDLLLRLVNSRQGAASRVASIGAAAVLITGCSQGASTSRPAIPSAEPSVTAAASVSAEASATAVASPADEDPTWTESGSFGSSQAMAQVNGVAALGDGFVAVGTEIQRAQPVILGPTAPDRGLVWRSSDGATWESVTLGAALDGVDLTGIYVAADGMAIAYGIGGDPGTGTPPPRLVAFESSDGLSWSAIGLGLPAGAILSHLEQGAQGYLATTYDLSACCTGQAWFSVDGRSWQPTGAVAQGASVQDVGAGDEGFVVVGGVSTAEGLTTHVYASADGLAWVEAVGGPPITSAASLDADWVGTGTTFAQAGVDETLWVSANGLDWTEEPLDLAPVPDDSGNSCHEVPSALHSSAGMVVMPTRLVGGLWCGEGGLFRYGAPYISTDGTTWTALPFPTAVSDRERGSAIHDLVVNGDVVILVGESQAAAAFWLGEVP